MAALDIVSLDTATPQLEVPGAADTYAAPRALAISPVALTGSAATPSLDIAQTWNTTGTPTGIRLSVTDTASNAASNLLELRGGAAGTTSLFAIRRADFSGTRVDRPVFGLPAYSYTAIQAGGFFAFGVNESSVNVAINIGAGAGIDLQANSPLRWSNSNANIPAGSADLSLFRDAANTLAQRNSTNAQAFRLYGTYTAADNFQRLNAVVAKTASGALSGASVTLSGAIPDGAVVVGVTSRVTTLLTGATGYLIGTSGDTDRFGDITGTAVGTVSKNSDWTAGTVECFTAATDIVLTAKTSDFTAGAIEVCVHYLLGDAD